MALLVQGNGFVELNYVECQIAANKVSGWKDTAENKLSLNICGVYCILKGLYTQGVYYVWTVFLEGYASNMQINAKIQRDHTG